MCAMSPRLLRPVASGVHPEAADWRARVVDNGGTVSTSTANAVSDFCWAIDSAGLRSKLTRVNLMCGSNLNAVLVPLYRATSRTGTPLGNATDTNDNFVPENYSESSGLIGNGTDKRLRPGLLRSAISDDASLHVGAFIHTRSTLIFRTYMGFRIGNTAFNISTLASRNPSTDSLFANTDAVTTGVSPAVATSDGDFVFGCVSGVGAGLLRLYINGSSSGTGAGVDTSGYDLPYLVFATYRSDGDQVVEHSDARIGGYTLGLNLTDTESAAYAAIWDTFLRALGRR